MAIRRLSSEAMRMPSGWWRGSIYWVLGFARIMFFVPIFRANLVLIASHGSGSSLRWLPVMDGPWARSAAFFCHFLECPTWLVSQG